MKKLQSLILAILWSTGIAFSASSGTCGDDLTWTLDDDGVLTISGTGAMTSYSYYGAPWYSYGFQSISSLVIEDGVTSIGDYAFTNGDLLTSIEIPESVTSIGSYAFQYCTSLTSITIPESVTSIGSCAFSCCTSLTSITVSEGNTAYVSVDGVLYTYDMTELICYPASKTDTSFTIPDAVTSIGSYAFYECTSLTSITIPDDVISIGSYAFYECTSLTSITISESVTSISSWAFSGCTSLTSVTIPDSVTSIGSYAFYRCTKLTSITIPDAVTSIGSYAFYYCSSLTSVTSLATTPPTCSGDPFSSSTYSSVTLTAASKLYQYAEYWKKFSTIEYTEDAQTDLTSISGQCGDNLTWTLSLADSTLTITGSGDMYDYSSSSYAPWYIYASLITSVTISDEATSIGDYAFYYCTSLTSVTIGSGVTSIGTRAFYYCTSLTSITIPDGMTSIGFEAFCYCTSLTSVTIGSGVTSIGNYAFYYCISLTSITSLNTTPPTCSYVFSSSTYTSATLTSASNLYAYANVWKEFSTIEYTEDAQTDLTTISGQCGDDLTWTLSLADSTLTITGSGDMYDYTMYNAPWYGFYGCVSAVSLPDDLTSIGNYAFHQCTALTSVDIPESVTSIGVGAFWVCSSLTSVNIPSGITSISVSSFRLCTSLTSIEIPEGVTSIGNYAFYQCTALTSVTSLASTPPTCGSNVFSSSTYTSATLYAASTDYLTADYWEDFENYVISGNAISDITAEASTIRTVGNTIVITSPARATAKVVSLNGTIIKEVIVYQGETQIQMAHGSVYIVLLSDGTKAKVLIK